MTRVGSQRQWGKGGGIRRQTTSKVDQKPVCRTGTTLKNYILNFGRNSEGESNHYGNTDVDKRIILK
jgi:hypothetical protein